MSTDIIDELHWRGLIAQSTDLDHLREQLASGVVTVYNGFDPTGPSLHAGHLVPLLTLRRFQLAGHRPIVLAGGATGMIGDPREIGERSMQTADTVGDWADRIRAQLERFVSLDDSPTGAIVANNLDWIGKLSVVDFLRDVGKHFPVNVMLSRDVVKRRLDADGISYTEFSYMLLQAYDFVELNRRHDCLLQLGGSDQWGNIIAGVDLGRRILGESLHAMTVPLVTAADGKKFGKTTGGGGVWLDPSLTSPYAWYQYFVNTADADVVRYLRWFTFLDRDEIDELEKATTETPHLREAQKRLAAEMTTLVHGEQATRAVQTASQALFGRAELTDLDEPTLAGALGETDVVEFAVESAPNIVELLVATGLSESNKAARRAITEGGAYVNNQKITDAEWVASQATRLHDGWLVLRRGKKSIAGVHFVAAPQASDQAI